MAEIYRRVEAKGKRLQLEKAMALLLDVQVELDKEAFRGWVVARDVLAQHREYGYAEINKTAGDIDRYLNLDDKFDEKHNRHPNAMAIEYGRDETRVEELANGDVRVTSFKVPGVYALHRAFRIRPGGYRGTGGPNRRKGGLSL